MDWWVAKQVWRLNEKTGEWQQEGAPLSGHTDWVRDVAWMPNLGLPCSTLASAGQDGKVLVWSESRELPGSWTSVLLHDFKARVLAWGVPPTCLTAPQYLAACALASSSPMPHCASVNALKCWR
jgi:protein transport protein SEC13